jgi:TolB protein
MLPAAVSNQQSQSAFATFPGENGKIAFTSTRDGNPEIYVMNADGSEQTRLTDNPATDFQPSWSPDGTKIAFSSDRSGASNGWFEVYVMNADGSEQTRLTFSNPFFEGDPSWSPDGTKIAFSTGRHGSDNREIYVMNADGSGQTRLTNSPFSILSPTGHRMVQR